MKKKNGRRGLARTAQVAAADLARHLPISRTALGIDLERIERFKKMLSRFSVVSLRRIFTKTELDYSLKKARPWQHLAVRFAAKEAAYKALHQLGITVIPTQVEVKNRPDGAPQLHLRGSFPKVKLLVSLSHAESHALALVLAWQPDTKNRTP